MGGVPGTAAVRRFVGRRDRVVLGLLAIVVASAGCVDSPAGSGPEDFADSPGAGSAAAPEWKSVECAYQETLLVIDAEDAQELVPVGYSPVNGLTNEESTALLFIPYQGCQEEWVMVGVTVRPPSDAPGEATLNGYLLGSFVEDPEGNLSAILPGPIEAKSIDRTMTGALSNVEVKGSVTMTAAHEARNDFASSSPFTIRLFHQHDGNRSTLLLTAADLERENSAGTFEASSLFGHEIPDGAPIQFVGTIKNLTLLRLE